MKNITQMIWVTASLACASVGWADAPPTNIIEVGNDTGKSITICFSQGADHQDVGIPTLTKVEIGSGARYTIARDHNGEYATDITVTFNVDGDPLTCTHSGMNGTSAWDKTNLAYDQFATAWSVTQDYPKQPTYTRLQCVANCECMGVSCVVVLDVTNVDKR